MTSNAKDSAIQPRIRPFVLIIRDGWGENPYPHLQQYDATHFAQTPVDEQLKKNYPRCLIATSGEDVGLPKGTMGNSEVGHQNIGAGRIVDQDSMRLTRYLRDESFFKNSLLLQAIAHCKQNNSRLHLLGLASDAGVHSRLEHLYGLLELARREELSEVYLHAFTDGRDTPPRSGIRFLEQIEDKMKALGVGRIASIVGRFWAMDRDQRWERIEKAYRCLREGKAAQSKSAQQAMQDSYDSDITDEFVEPVCIVNPNNQPLAQIEDGDAVIFLNFRGDRPRQITRALVDPDFSGFDRESQPKLFYVCMTQYDETIPAPVAFPKLEKKKNIVADYLSQLGLKQFHCAETEKYAHVTFFFNDYTEAPFPGEERQIVPSPKVRTYDMKPEMSAYELTEMLLERLESATDDFILLNFANPDMVGHTGDLQAAIKSAETVDECVGRILEKVRHLGGSAIVTADHGNLEKMYDPEADCPMTSHTTYTVPFYVVDKKFKHNKLRDGGRLADVIPTALHIMGIAKPAEMTGESLIVE
jgi:2,3-bisphosphoglycerate-independent phosphoglycerate mutase